ncbi:MAG: PHP domain-containing protein [Candidatus Brockarchaeota archaeon]|nr:PHP domain-containing protein [Candidatus Brockarchaeota archaeon]
MDRRCKIPKTDYHVHSQFSKCANDVTVSKDVQRALAKGISRIAVTDHGSVKKPEWIRDYFREIEESRKSSKLDVLAGIECDMDADGCPVVSEAVLADMDVVVGALHELPGNPASSYDEAIGRYAKAVSAALENGWMRILAHPTDVGWVKLKLPSEVAGELSRIAARKGVAFELNFHHKDPGPEDLGTFLKNGVAVTPTSDAHSLDEIGNYGWHESLLEKCGFRGEVPWLEL